MSNPLVDGWGEFLGGFYWDWFVTLTFEGDVKTFTAHNRCEAWLTSLEKAAGQPISWFRGDEYGEKFGKFHIHLLIGNVAGLHRFTWMKRWEARNGFARILPFDPTKDAPFSVAKYVTKQFGDWELSSNITAFRVQQPVLPLVGQIGSPVIEETPHVAAESRRRMRPVGRNRQLPIGNFRETGSDDFETGPIVASFREQTKRRK